MANNLTHYAEAQIGAALLNATNLTAPTLYFGLCPVTVYTISTAYTLNQIVVPTAANANGHVYKCTTAGTSAGSEPVWPTAEGGTVTSGGATFTEDVAELEAGTLPELTIGVNGYARFASSSWTLASNAPASGTTATLSANDSSPAGTSTGYGTIGAGFLFDAATSGNAWVWMVFAQPGVTLSVLGTGGIFEMLGTGTPSTIVLN